MDNKRLSFYYRFDDESSYEDYYTSESEDINHMLAVFFKDCRKISSKNQSINYLL